MISFESDYTEGAHEKILQRLAETNLEQTSGYGNDRFCQSAKEKIRRAFDCPHGEVFFLVGGTQANSTVIASMLDDYEGVVCVESGHINVHEAGAVEFTGHKVLTLPSHDGKMLSSDLEAYLKVFFADETCDHMVQPGMVYISFPTEFGTIYSLKELEDIHCVSSRYGLPLFIDGARLGYGLMSPYSDVRAGDMARLCEVFYVGGTKVGALFGEAVVFPRNNAPAHFFTTIKLHGALLAKGRLLGLQFDTLFTDGLYFKIAGHAVRMAMLMKRIFRDKGYRLYIDSPTNQQFFVLPNDVISGLREKVGFEVWGPFSETESIVRFVTSWATDEDNVLRLKEIL